VSPRCEERAQRNWLCERVRPSAVALAVALVAGGCARSEEQWLADLDSADPFVRAVAAMALCDVAPEHAARAVPVLLETVDRSDVGLERQAARQLARIAPRAAEPLIASLLGDEFMTSDRRSAALAALTASGANGARAIVAALRGSGREHAADFAVVLVRIGAASVPALVELLAEADKPELQRYAAFVLGQFGPAAHAAIPALQAQREHADLAVRSAVLEALARITADQPTQRGPEGLPARGH
jgi:HEAT repeat protein